MRAFAIYNPLVRTRRACAWLLCEPALENYTIELASWATPKDLPLTLAIAAEEGDRRLGSEWSYRWVITRVPPENRDNLSEVLAANHCYDYYLPALLAATKGRSSHDDFLLEEVPAESYRSCNLNTLLEEPAEVGVLLSRARRAAGLTQLQLAECCGIQQAVISRIEGGLANPTIETLETLANGCGRKLSISFE